MYPTTLGICLSTLGSLYMSESINILEGVQKFACRVCLGQCCSDYEAMLNRLDIPTLLTHHRYLKITTMFNIINGYHYFPTGVFTRRSIQSTRQLRQELSNNFCVPFARTQYLFFSLVPIIVLLDFGTYYIPISVKTSTNILEFKRLHYGSCLN